jgi:hypothetical protein
MHAVLPAAKLLADHRIERARFSSGIQSRTVSRRKPRPYDIVTFSEAMTGRGV